MLKVDLFRAILRFFLLSEWCILLGSFRVLLCLRIDYLFLYDRCDDIDQDLICLQGGDDETAKEIADAVVDEAQDFKVEALEIVIFIVILSFLSS